MFTSQVGSGCDKVEYEEDVHVLTANIDFNPIKPLSLSLNASYTIGEADMDDPRFKNKYPQIFFNGDQSGSSSFYILYISQDGQTLDYSGFGDYSDLDYSIFDITFNVNYDINEHWGIYGVFNLTDFEDDEPYAYGDLDGTFYSANIGIQYKF